MKDQITSLNQKVRNKGTEKGAWNGLFLAHLLQLDKYQGTKDSPPVGGEGDGKHRHPDISGIYTLHQDISLKYEGANYSLFNIDSKRLSVNLGLIHGNRASWELFEDMCCIIGAICRTG